MQITSLLGNSQRLDGGAMFGNAPKVMWERWVAPDEQNRIPLACRAMLIEEASGRRILCEAGIGAFFPPAMRERYGVVEAHHVLLESLAAHGLSPADIDVVVLSHLHFDHAGGLLSSYEEGAAPRLVFPNAHYVVGKEAFERAKHPHARDRASFIEVLPGLLEQTERLELVTGEQSEVLGAAYRLHFSEGHTPGLMLLEVATDRGPLVFAGDLIPGTAWIHVPITMGYDRFPERVIEEKGRLLSDLVDRKGSLFFTHDASVAIAAVQRDEKGKYSAGECIAHATRLAL